MANGIRDLYIDTVRGICVIAIIFIHTVFWSGVGYCPDWIRNLALLVDVPLFFFLTGCTMSIYSKLNPLKQIFKLTVLFFLAVLICQIIFLDFNLKRLLAPLILCSSDIPKIKLISGSYWFVPVYAAGLLYAKIMIDYLKKNIINGFLVFVPIFYCYLYFSKSVYNYPAVFGGISIQMFLFYLWLIILGYKTYNFNKKYVWLSLSFVALIITATFAITQTDFSLQAYKFPVVALPYAVASMISVGLTMALKRQIKDNFLAYLGQKAIYFYLSQGISSSILFSIVKIIHLNWPIKLLICFSANCFMAIVIGILISKIEPKILSTFTKIQHSAA